VEQDSFCLLFMEPFTSSHDLIERVRQGDGDAFRGLFAKYRHRLAVLIHYRLGPELRRHADVEDILQETLLKAFRDIRQFDYQSPGSFFRWLARIADHIVADMARFQGRQKRAAEVVRFRSESNPGGPEPADTGTPSRIFRENEALGRLIEELNLLSEDYRRVILLSKVEGLTTAEVAQQLGKSNEATALLLHRAIKRFRALHGGQGK
jgi:RNA polymerase sigma-70 factor (subfamily 1)